VRNLIGMIFVAAIGAIFLGFGVHSWINTDRIVDRDRQNGMLNPKHSRVMHVVGRRALAVLGVLLGGVILVLAFTNN